MMLGVMAGSGALWTPADLPIPPGVWMDDQSSITDAGGGACSQWNDRSGGGRHFSQSSGAARPLIVSAGLNGLRTVRFDGTSQFLQSGLSGTLSFTNGVSGIWCFTVYKKTGSDGAGTDRMMVNFTRGTDGGTRFASYASHVAANNTPRMLVRRLDADASASLAAASSPGTSWLLKMDAIDYSAGDGFLYMDGAISAQNFALTTSGNTSATDSNNAASVGAQFTGNLPADVEIACVLVGVGALPSADDTDRIHGWAAHHFGLTANLDVAHPYKTTPP